MGQTLTHGVYLPSEGERNCYSGLASNWRLLDGAIGTVAAHTTAISGKADISHTHGNISNDGKVGTTANLPLITGTGGAVQAGAFGNQANTFCEGNDSRLSDARTPVAHTHGKADVTDLFNSANTWTGSQTYSGMLSLSSSSDVTEQFKQKLPKDVSTSNDAMARVNALVDSAGHYVVVETIGHWSNYVAKNLTLKYKNDSAKQRAIEFRLYSDGTGILYPQTPFECDLGNSYNKWKSFNGINPGALSLPDASNAIALDTTNVSMDGTYTYLSVSVNGWLYVNLRDTSIKTDGELTFYMGDSGTSGAYAKWAVNLVCSTDSYVRCFIPVLANSRIRIRVNPNGGSPTGLTMTIYPCQGNV